MWDAPRTVCWDVGSSFECNRHDEFVYAMDGPSDFETSMAKAVHKPIVLYCGVQILPLIFDMLQVYIPDYNTEDFCIRNNQVMYGAMDKTIIGSANNSSVHLVYLQKGHLVAVRFIELLQRAAIAFPLASVSQTV